MNEKCTRRLSLLFLMFVFLLSSCASSIRPYIKAGSLEKITWGISKEAFLKRLGPLVKKAIVKEGKVIYKIRYISNYGYGVKITTKVESFGYYFNDSNQLYKVMIMYLGTFNRPAIRAVVEREIDLTDKYKSMLGKPDSEKPTSFVYKKQRYPSGVVTWKAKKGRVHQPDTEVKLITVGNRSRVLFVERYVNVVLKPKVESDNETTSDKDKK